MGLRVRPCVVRYSRSRILIQLVGVEFFNDILVPPDLLLDGARLWGPPSLSIPQAIDLLTRNSDYADQVWIWDSEDGSSFYFDVGEIVRLRVEMEEWHDQIPNAPDPGDGSTTERKPPYSIIVGIPLLPFLSFQRGLRMLTVVQGSMQMAGLGPTSWW